MHIPDLIRDSLVGQIIYICSGRRLLRYPEEQPDFILPEHYLGATQTQRPPSATESKKQRYSVTERTVEGTVAGSEEQEPPEESAFAQEYFHSSSHHQPATPLSPHNSSAIHDVEKAELAARTHAESVGEASNATVIVHWYGPDDPECPKNVCLAAPCSLACRTDSLSLQWSLFKRGLVTFDVCLITFAVYIGSAIFAPGIPDLAEKFGISEVAASLGLTMFIVGYGVGPMFLSPLSEIPQFGRAPVYIITLVIFVALQVPTALGKNLGTVVSMRFLAGFIGSPPLATGGASLADLWPPEDLAPFIGLWSLAAMSGPAVGPIVGGFAAQAKGWTWTIWPLMWLGGASIAWLAFSMPETSSQTYVFRNVCLPSAD